MLDDTCYFIGFDTYVDALITASLFNSDRVKQFLRSIVFKDTKRPYTKEVLMRINVAHAAAELSLAELYEFWARIGYEARVFVTELDLESYKEALNANSKDRAPQFILSG